jgi:hypothetical protein
MRGPAASQEWINIAMPISEAMSGTTHTIGTWRLRTIWGSE